MVGAGGRWRRVLGTRPPKLALRVSDAENEAGVRQRIKPPLTTAGKKESRNKSPENDGNQDRGSSHCRSRNCASSKNFLTGQHAHVAPHRRPLSSHTPSDTTDGWTLLRYRIERFAHSPTAGGATGSSPGPPQFTPPKTVPEICQRDLVRADGHGAGCVSAPPLRRPLVGLNSSIKGGKEKDSGPAAPLHRGRTILLSDRG